MSWTKKLEATAKGYRYVWSRGSLCLFAPHRVLKEHQTLATDEQIEAWIAKQAAAGKQRADIERALESRIADVASGYEDDWQ
jgi:hypothetical protein